MLVSPLCSKSPSSHQNFELYNSNKFYKMASGDITNSPPQPSGTGIITGCHNESALLSLMERTGYTMIQENGQRKYGGPPPGWGNEPTPSRGCEVFVGKIPRDCYEDELVPVFEKIGRIYELRLMMDFSGLNRGYCFVMFCNKEHAKRAVTELNNYELRKGRFLGVCLSVDNCRLFVGGIPKNKQRDEIFEEMCKVTEGVVDVIVYPSATDKAKNRGFAFVEYVSHRSAAMARRKLIPGRIQLWGHQIAVDWAEPEQEVDEDIMSKVRILYVRNLMLSTTEEDIEKYFNMGKTGAVERVKKIRDYAFVHFREREDAILAMQTMNNTLLEGSRIEVVWAKPVDKNDYVRYTRAAGRITNPLEQAAATVMAYPTAATAIGAYPPSPFYGFPGAGALQVPTAAITDKSQFELQTLLASGAAASVGTVPAVSTGAPGSGVYRSPVRSARGAAGARGAGGSRSRVGARPGAAGAAATGAAGAAAYTRTGAGYKLRTGVELLEEVCTRNGWGAPIYNLHSTMGRDGAVDVQLFLYKVVIPALMTHYPGGFQPNKLCRTVDEAKQLAAEQMLMQLSLSSTAVSTMQAAVENPECCAAAAAAAAAGGPAAALMAPGGQQAMAAALYQGSPISIAGMGGATAAAAYPLGSPVAGAIPGPIAGAVQVTGASTSAPSSALSAAAPAASNASAAAMAAAAQYSPAATGGAAAAAVSAVQLMTTMTAGKMAAPQAAILQNYASFPGYGYVL